MAGSEPQLRAIQLTSGRRLAGTIACALALLALAANGGKAQPALEAALEQAAQLPRLQAMIVAQHGAIVAERRFRGPGLDQPCEIKSVSKSIISALVGIAIERGKLRGVDQPIAPFFARALRGPHGPRIDRITIGQLLSMQSGLVRTSGPEYARWVSSKNWIEYILRAPLLADPGGPMIYSTGNTHLLSAILTQATGQSTFAFARDALFKPLGIALASWTRDPQGIFMGGNQMQLSAHALLRFGELYRNRGEYQGRALIPAAWIDASWAARTRSIFSGQAYGYGWFASEVAGHALHYAWGYGGQFIFIVPDLELTVVTTSVSSGPRDFDHLGEIFRIFTEVIVPALS
jgi:CubicO group peptidase (beta-lactamase class C family)